MLPIFTINAVSCRGLHGTALPRLPRDETGARRTLSTPPPPYTHALISAVPTPDSIRAITGRIRLQGDPPSPISPPPGCRFARRCAFAQERRCPSGSRSSCRRETAALGAIARRGPLQPFEQLLQVPGEPNFILLQQSEGRFQANYSGSNIQWLATRDRNADQTWRFCLCRWCSLCQWREEVL